MNENKAKVIAYSAYKAYEKLMFLVSSLDNEEDDIINNLKNNCLQVSAKISYEILYQIYNEFPNIKKDIDLLNELIPFVHNNKIKPLKQIDTEEKARVVIYLATSAFNDLAGRLIPHVISKNENKIAQSIAEQSKDIILNILTPLFNKFPSFKNELDEIQNTFGFFPY